MKHFFSASDLEAKGDTDTLCVVIPKAITSAPELIQHLATGLKFPPGFGGNWNAVFDFLCNLDWLAQKRIAIVHEDVPPIPPLQLETYLKVLDDAVETWEFDSSGRKLFVVFPDNAEVLK